MKTLGAYLKYKTVAWKMRAIYIDLMCTVMVELENEQVLLVLNFVKRGDE